MRFSYSLHIFHHVTYRGRQKLGKDRLIRTRNARPAPKITRYGIAWCRGLEAVFRDLKWHRVHILWWQEDMLCEVAYTSAILRSCDWYGARLQMSRLQNLGKKGIFALNVGARRDVLKLECPRKYSAQYLKLKAAPSHGLSFKSSKRQWSQATNPTSQNSRVGQEPPTVEGLQHASSPQPWDE